ncbi:glycosyltransferase family 29 protein [Paracoccus sp. MBLB3053]|uniref:Glycosyltransferase family 29 protein n=1 Tax=Paracoccus aurantius TaxID=3073814 RepID=A0ABU2HQ94_9RHOB|nr:glycosyltransferase family 29 protein [Paracoccus sp. MBLB3053]MDS9466764.1 glycosyltransferase family 29 protein [Paracoccus sp. MBLB3053]
MNRLGFLVRRTIRDEAALQRLSVPQSELMAELAGKDVALVGNARALAGSRHGQAIDAADLVIRINRAPMPHPESHGTRTDWLGLAVALGREERARIRPGRILWMSHKRKRLDWQSANSPGFYLHPLADYAALKTDLHAPPTTGALLIELISRSKMTRLRLYGFDFFASLSLSGSRTADKVPHDFGNEAEWVANLHKNDKRIMHIR